MYPSNNAVYVNAKTFQIILFMTRERDTHRQREIASEINMQFRREWKKPRKPTVVDDADPALNYSSFCAFSAVLRNFVENKGLVERMHRDLQNKNYNVLWVLQDMLLHK